MMRFTVVALVALTVLGNGYAQDSDSPLKSRSLKPKTVRFVPPSNMIKIGAVDLTGTEEFHRLKVARMQAARERVLRIPLKNISDRPLKITNVAVSCGCMAAIANDLEIGTGETSMLYLRVTPTAVGRFAKRMTVSFEDSPNVTCVIESTVSSAFDVTPNAIVIKPGGSNGSELTVKSDLDLSGFEARSLNPFLTLKFVRQEPDGSHVFKCQLASAVDGNKVPADLVVPIQVRHLGKSYEYSLRVYNSEAVKIQPKIVFARRNAQNSNALEFFVLVKSWSKQKDLVCKIAEPKKGLSLKVKQRKSLPGGTLIEMVTFVIAGDTRSVEEA